MIIAGFYQFDVAFGEKERNIAKVEEALSSARFDLMVLPELFSTGYLYNSREELLSLAEEIPNGFTAQRLSALSVSKKAYITGSVPEREGNKIYNTAILSGPEGYIGKYRKIHIPKFEVPLFDSGCSLPVFSLNGYKIGIAICFDIWFPETCRILMLNGAQVICSPSAFGGPLSLDIIKVRAIENMVYTITSNRTGYEQRGNNYACFRGESRITKYDGTILSFAQDREMMALAEIYPERAYSKENTLCGNLYHELEKYQLSAQYPIINHRKTAGLDGVLEDISRSNDIT